MNKDDRVAVSNQNKTPTYCLDLYQVVITKEEELRTDIRNSVALVLPELVCMIVCEDVTKKTLVNPGLKTLVVILVCRSRSTVIQMTVSLSLSQLTQNSETENSKQ